MCIRGSLGPNCVFLVEPNAAGCIPALEEMMWIFQRQYLREGDERSHFLDLLQPLGLRISVPRMDASI